MNTANNDSPLLERHHNADGLRRVGLLICQLIPTNLRDKLIAAFASLYLVFYLLHVFAQGGGMYYIVKDPTFAVSSLRLPLLNVDAEDRLTSMLHVNLTTRNPNSVSGFGYEEFRVHASSNGTLIGSDLLPHFDHPAKETAVLSVSLTSDKRKLSPGEALTLSKSSRVLLEINLESKVKVTSWLIETVQVRMEVHCKGIQVPLPKGQANPPPQFADAPCKVMFRGFNIFHTVLKRIWEIILEICETIGDVVLG